MRACTTIAAWSAAFTANNGAGFTGTPTEVLTNVCSAPEVASAPLCKLIAAPRPGVTDIVNQACAGTTYSRCVQTLTQAMDIFPGTLIAICEYPDGEGDVVTVDASETPEAACSGGGLITPSAVHGTLTIPDK